MIEAEEKYYPHNIAWIILNRLKDFNEKPDFIKALSHRFTKLTTHTIYFKFAPLYEEAVKYFEVHNKFPDIKYFNERFPDGRVMWEMTNVSLSMDMYDTLKKQLDYELIIQDFNKRIGESETIDIEAVREFSKVLAKFAETNVDIPVDTKEDWINSYEKLIENYHGISTGIKMLDEQIGDLSGIVTVAAPSGHGKSTFALSLAYNIATQADKFDKGRNVLYISFEMTKSHLQASLVSIESSFSDDESRRLKATDIKRQTLTEEQKKLYKEHMYSFMQKTNNSGGYIALHDNTSMTGYSTIEEFMATIEEYSAKLNRKFDIIFIDNIDSLNMLQGEKGQGEMDKMNTFITKLDSFSKTYMNGYGTTIVLLSQTNREGINKLRSLESDTNREITFDGTVLQRYSALYERATMVLVLYSSPMLRMNNQLLVSPVKLRNKPLPGRALPVTTSWDYSYVGKFTGTTLTNKNNQTVQKNTSNQEDIDDIPLEEDDDLSFD